jgi:hypothetical protein
MTMLRQQVTLQKGQRIYNHGDMANPSHFGTVTDVKGENYEITPDAGSNYDHGPYWIPQFTLSPVFLGHGGTRIVTEQAYTDWRAVRVSESLAAFTAALKDPR